MGFIWLQYNGRVSRLNIYFWWTFWNIALLVCMRNDAILQSLVVGIKLSRQEMVAEVPWYFMTSHLRERERLGAVSWPWQELSIHTIAVDKWSITAGHILDYSWNMNIDTCCRGPYSKYMKDNGTLPMD